MYILLVLTLVIATCLIPLLVPYAKRYFRTVSFYAAPRWLPALSGLLFLLAFYIPDVHISNQTTTFQQHFVGGGMYVACLFVYFKKLLGWKLHWMIMLLALFAWSAAFGVANELLEFMLTQLKLAQIDTGDTDWDLLANTLGAFVGYGLLLTKIDRAV